MRNSLGMHAQGLGLCICFLTIFRVLHKINLTKCPSFFPFCEMEKNPNTRKTVGLVDALLLPFHPTMSLECIWCTLHPKNVVLECFWCIFQPRMHLVWHLILLGFSFPCPMSGRLLYSFDSLFFSLALEVWVGNWSELEAR